MIFLAVAFGLLLHAFFWGAGLAMLGMPWRWRRFWPMLVLPGGFLLQSLVVWIGAYAHLRGTNSYALAAELVPLALLALGLRRLGLRRARLDLTAFGLVWAITAGVLVLLAIGPVIATRGLTSISLGSCDAADYAAGARVFMEFAHGDRSGFLGLTEVVHIMSTDNFFDFWLRLNHFTPSALMALNGSVFHCPPYQIATVITAVILAATIPIAFWSARAVFGYSGVASLALAGVFGISPIPWYSVGQVSPAPLLAANAIALLNWAGITLWNGRLTARRGLQFGLVLLIGYGLVLGAYNFILIVSLVPAVAYVGARVLATGEWRRFGQWVAVMLAPLAVAGLVFYERVTGLVERFLLFQTYDFGWRIPALLPEGWYGMVQGGDLEPWHWAGLRWLLATMMLTTLGWAVFRALRDGHRRGWVVVSTIVPVLMGYTFLELRGIVRDTNASYDAFKLFTVFYPLLLPAFCWWITLRWSFRLAEWLEVAVLSSIVIAFNLVACAMFVFHLARPPLVVDGELRQLRRIEAMPEVGSLNMLIPDMWSRLWANELLLRKPQFFQTHTYEGRLNTPLRGQWDLVSGPVRVQLEPPAERDVTAHYRLLDTRAPWFLRAEPGTGWYGEERLPNGDRWSWTRGDASIRVDNPHSYPITLQAVLDGRLVQAGDVALVAPGGSRPSFVRVGADRSRYDLGRVTVPPGRSTLVLHLKQHPAAATDDTRPLGVCVFSLGLRPVGKP